MTEFALAGIFLGVAMVVVTTAALRASVAETSRAFEELFAPGNVPPYTWNTSLRARFLLPWTRIDRSALSRTATLWLALARVCAALSIISLIALVTLFLLEIR